MTLTPNDYQRGFNDGVAQSVLEPCVMLLGDGTGVAVGGRFHGWLMRQHPDGHWVSVRKLDAVDPFDNPLGRLMKATQQTKAE